MIDVWSQQTFSVKGQMINISGFANQMVCHNSVFVEQNHPQTASKKNAMSLCGDMCPVLGLTVLGPVCPQSHAGPNVTLSSPIPDKSFFKSQVLLIFPAMGLVWSP